MRSISNKRQLGAYGEHSFDLIHRQKFTMKILQYNMNLSLTHPKSIKQNEVCKIRVNYLVDTFNM